MKSFLWSAGGKLAMPLIGLFVVFFAKLIFIPLGIIIIGGVLFTHTINQIGGDTGAFFAVFLILLGIFIFAAFFIIAINLWIESLSSVFRKLFCLKTQKSPER
ncbi:MAG: hypothetical protein FWC77_03270 [Defluviitaleaceae bacterium]|nr:hypothetical protein [Defluviitaleaceae bacterium]